MLVVRGISPNQAGYYWHDPAEQQWLGAGLRALGGEPTLDARSLCALLDGIDPTTGEILAAARPGRRAGWDLIFAAPKSVSLLAALAPAEAAEVVHRAHAAAVEEAIGFVEARAAWARRGRLGPQRVRNGTVRSEVDGVVAAAFTHRFSAAGEPHLHAHVVLANLAPAPDGRWAALAHDALWPAHQAIRAAYQLGLRHHLTRLGLAFDWTGTDVSGVPEASIRAASSRLTEITAAQVESAAARQVAAHKLLGRTAQGDGWRDRVQAAGFGPAEAARLTGEARSNRGAAERPDPAAVAEWLAARSSAFGPLRVVVALAATTPAGMDAQTSAAWADRFCAAAIPAAGRRVTTPTAAAEDRALLDAVDRGAGRGVGVAAAWVEPFAPAGVARLLRSGDAVEVVRAAPARDGPLVAQAAVLDRARQAWEATGFRVAVLAPSPRAAARWEALTGIDAYSAAGADVLIVDRADRLPTRQLLELAAAARQEARKLVLVEGGTLSPARHPLSAGFASVAGQTPPLDLLPPARMFGAAVERWARERRAGREAVLVGLGPAEVGALNAVARERLIRAGRVGGPAMEAYGRSFQAGDRVLALRQGAGQSGAVGTVVEVAARRGVMLVDWGGERPVLVERTAAGRLSHGYATTPGYLGRVAGQVVAVADPRLLRGHRHRLVDAFVAVPRRDPPARARTVDTGLGL